MPASAMRQYLCSMDQIYSYEPHTPPWEVLTVVAVAVVLGFAGTYWLVSARHWFTGPKVQGSPEELAEIEQELESLA